MATGYVGTGPLGRGFGAGYCQLLPVTDPELTVWSYKVIYLAATAGPECWVCAGRRIKAENKGCFLPASGPGAGQQKSKRYLEIYLSYWLPSWLGH